MDRWLGCYSEVIYLTVRVVTGLLFACHGSQKLLNFPAGEPHSSGTLFLCAAAIELVAGGLIALGLGASYAAFLASGEMAVAYFMVHASKGFFPIQNKGELAVIYCFIFLYIASRGSGLLSVDRLIRGKARAQASVDDR